MKWVPESSGRSSLLRSIGIVVQPAISKLDNYQENTQQSFFKKIVTQQDFG
jgi:hypothetical protein